MSDDERFDVYLLGEKIGTATGWDGDGLCSFFYDFKPKDFSIFPNIEGEVGLNVLYDTGRVEMVTSEVVLKSFKMGIALTELKGK